VSSPNPYLIRQNAAICTMIRMSRGRYKTAYISQINNGFRITNWEFTLTHMIPTDADIHHHFFVPWVFDSSFLRTFYISMYLHLRVRDAVHKKVN
jgi:hypothetical protein